MVIGYLRVSTDKQTIENQRFEIQKFAKGRNWTVGKWIEETASGTKKVSERQLGKAIKRVRKGDTLITSELSRIGRNLLEVMSFLNYCMLNDITVIAIKEDYELGNDLSAKVLAFAFSLSAEIERNLLSMRTREALEKKLEGVKLGRPKGSKSSHYKLSGQEAYIKQSLNYKRSLKEISKRLEVSRQTLRDFMKKNPSYYTDNYESCENFTEYQPQNLKPIAKAQKKKK